MTRRYHSNINTDGIRSDNEPAAFRAENFNVVFLGDSFVYGWRAKKGQTFPVQFERLAIQAGHDDIRSVNFGWVSSSPFLSNRLLHEIGQKYQPDLVVLLLDMTDIFDDRLYRNIAERKHIFRWGKYFPAITQFASLMNQGFWQSDAIAGKLFGVPGRHYFIVERPLSESRVYFDETMANVDAINDYCRDVLKVPFVLFVLPRHFQFDPDQSPDNWEKDQYPLAGPYLLEPFRYFDEVAKNRSYPVVPLLADFRQAKGTPLVFQDDPHLNEAGNELLARLVWTHLRARALLP